MLLHETVSRSAERRPDDLALFSDEEALTYAQLDLASARMASLLQSAGCRPGDRVALLLPKSTAAIVSILGALKAGAIYVPLDAASPAPRLAKMIADSEPACIVAAGSGNALRELLASGAVGDSTRIGWVDRALPVPDGCRAVFRWDDLPSAPAGNPASAAAEDSPAHILFTSGSTGVPKGVVITHSNVSHFINWAVRYFGTTASDRISCHPPLHFDLSTFDIFGTFLAGAGLYLVPPEASLLPRFIAGFIRDHRLTQWFSVPAVLKYLAQFDLIGREGFPSLKRVLWCGEALPPATLAHWMSRLPGVTFTNLYGPTETTIASSYYTVPRRPENDTVQIPIGRPCDGEELIVLDESLEPVAAGQSGELYIRGVGLSPGYWRDPGKTDRAFLTDDRGGRMYKTGDLAKVGSDGLVYLLGRSDSQIKSRGYRIELGEIEAALNSVQGLREFAVVAVPTDGFEGVAICCAYAPQPGADVPPDVVRSRLAAMLPSYMLPARWLVVGSLPLNGNGKIDRRSIRERFESAVSAG